MGGRGSKAAPARPQRGGELHFTTTRRHLEEIDQLVEVGAATTRSEVLRRAFYEAQAAKTPLFRGGR